MANYIVLNDVTPFQGCNFTDQNTLFNRDNLNDINIIPQLLYSFVTSCFSPKYIAGFNILSVSLEGNRTIKVKVGPGSCVLERELIFVNKSYELDYELWDSADQTGSVALCISYKKESDIGKPILKLFYCDRYSVVHPGDIFKHSDSNLILGLFKFNLNDIDPNIVDEVRCVNDQFIGQPISILNKDYFLHNIPVPNTVLASASEVDNYPNYLKYKIRGGRNIQASPRYSDGDEFIRVELVDPDNIKLEFDNPEHYTPSDVPGLVSGNRLSTHLKGIDNELGDLDSRVTAVESTTADINDWESETFTLTSSQISNKFVDLAGFVDPAYTDKVLMIIGNAIPQRAQVDFNVEIYNGGYCRINWGGYPLEQVLQIGDKIALYYVHVD